MYVPGVFQSYSRARPLEEALAEIDRCSGTRFDPIVVAALRHVVEVHGARLFAAAPEPCAAERGEGEPSPIIVFPAVRPAPPIHVETGA